MLLLEREALPRVKPCGGGVSPEIAAWFDFDFSPVISARVTRLRFTFRHGDPVEAPMDTQESLWMVRRDAFDRFLASRRRTLGLSAMVFQDAWTLDLERLRQCHIHIVSPDARVIPFCAYNLTSVDGTSLYRGAPPLAEG